MEARGCSRNPTCEVRRVANESDEQGSAGPGVAPSAGHALVESPSEKARRRPDEKLRTILVTTVFDGLSDFFTGTPSPPGAVDEIERVEGVSLPQDYKQLLLTHGPGEGFVGEQYIILWDAAEIVQFNREYETKTYAPGFLLFASNGGGEGFAFDLRVSPQPIAMLPFIGMSAKSALKVAEKGTLLGVFYTPKDKGVLPALEQFEEDLRAELSRIE
jgi:hypothetical protein